MTAEQNENIVVGLIGFGEAGQAFANGWSSIGTVSVSAFDIKTTLSSELRQAKQRDYKENSVTGCDDLASALTAKDLVFSLVTADQAHNVAGDASPHLAPQAFFFDCNSCSPQTKQSNEQKIAHAGGRYVDVAVMAPVHPKLHKTPVLISGPDASEAAERLNALDMDVSIAGDQVGQASAIKLSRSIIVKGMEALLVECMLIARKLGVEDAVIDSLENSNPGYAWRDKASYALERMMVHGERRSEEMSEAAAMVAGLSIPDRMSRSISQWQRQVADLHIQDAGHSLGERTDKILKSFD